MALDWLIRDNEIKDHDLFGEEFFGKEPPCTTYEKKPLINPATGEVVEGLATAWVTLNNAAQYNSYTTEMVKGVIAGMHKGSMDREVQVIVFTGAGDRAFCTGGNTKEYAEYYSRRPLEYVQYMDLFSGMVDAILKARKPVICRCNGMRIAGGQEIGQACDFTVAADTAAFGQAGTRHGSTPTGGSTDFLPWNLSMEQAMWQATSNEMWSAYKMERLGLITKAIPIKKNGKGEWVRDPRVITDKYVDSGEIVYGEFKKGAEYKEANEELKKLTTDFSKLDAFIDQMAWTMTNTTFLCLMNTIESIRVKKKHYWDMLKSSQIYWLGANMNAEAFIGFNAFNTQKLTGQRTIDFLKYRKLLRDVRTFDDELCEEVLAKPKK
ncbi:MAG: 6-oxocyclohex-1-ene-1-carbonyl-CoA hydratase [Deltaproteobacteria bacterium]|nr:6-oxocyclohex-1-ene-1-carbonyl-CoA hydratase [Deltaproteobacteria bacterium]MBW1921483.1 6-oxocyclohex-1-ene-1-carbonyl-CoA hydratase [Deltaproteobacteria bacterium]MBW1935807.1 6-oxocyclohex-1-ene-1-carbonyl-CoA hydratase [Deltaproteobacteria bacterium]MBW1977472.1 6-oxocyclohex-1-ene-1-carbonyl-CoA hydratase [Deltaproteobacteria bacterium]MBW2043504.1 6-oxocyclohex-1-ene-1-carbonyl-CoA hydratase [Deltaproteobacteria bacterium]